MEADLARAGGDDGVVGAGDAGPVVGREDDAEVDEARRVLGQPPLEPQQRNRISDAPLR